jgi:hypothetical protein
MTIEKEAERDDLRTLLKFPQIGLPEYSADPIVQRRFGRVLAETSTHLHSRPILPPCADGSPSITCGKKSTTSMS